MVERAGLNVEPLGLHVPGDGDGLAQKECAEAKAGERGRQAEIGQLDILRVARVELGIACRFAAGIQNVDVQTGLAERRPSSGSTDQPPPGGWRPNGWG